ncbi:MAG TPA: S-methyl-5-thioribose-1-phosphate isomerase [Ktedonobacteraceae bacterium]
MNDQHWQPRVRTVWWEGDSADVSSSAFVCLVDQTHLPRRILYLRLAHEEQVAEAISALRVRGAPAIGVTAALGIALGIRRFYTEQGTSLTLAEAYAHVQAVSDLLKHTRPTAVNLFWAIERMMRRAEQVVQAQETPRQLVLSLQMEAQAIAGEDAAACLAMGKYGANLIADGDTLLTHCNAGALATSGIGTALAPIYVAHAAGKSVHVFVDETRPVLQGARLTAWELQQSGISLTLITDTMAGHFMYQRAIRAVFVGADRIAANGDVANKIGTYSLAVLARAHDIPFYVVAPCSTVDLMLSSGRHIPIEERRPEEVTTIGGVQVAPDDVHVANPAFDVTPRQYVTAIITEQGIAHPPYDVSLQDVCAQSNAHGKVY